MSEEDAACRGRKNPDERAGKENEPERSPISSDGGRGGLLGRESREKKSGAARWLVLATLKPERAKLAEEIASRGKKIATIGRELENY